MPKYRVLVEVDDPRGIFPGPEDAGEYVEDVAGGTPPDAHVEVTVISAEPA